MEHDWGNWSYDRLLTNQLILYFKGLGFVEAALFLRCIYFCTAVCLEALTSFFFRRTQCIHGVDHALALRFWKKENHVCNGFFFFFFKKGFSVFVKEILQSLPGNETFPSISKCKKEFYFFFCHMVSRNIFQLYKFPPVNVAKTVGRVLKSSKLKLGWTKLHFILNCFCSWLLDSDLERVSNVFRRPLWHH